MFSRAMENQPVEQAHPKN